MKLDDREVLALLAAIAGAVLGTAIGAFLLLLLGFWGR
jgi:integral membrane sensor domain MASE1